MVYIYIYKAFWSFKSFPLEESKVRAHTGESNRLCRLFSKRSAMRCSQELMRFKCTAIYLKLIEYYSSSIVHNSFLPVKINHPELTPKLVVIQLILLSLM